VSVVRLLSAGTNTGRLGVVGQSLEQSIPSGNVFGLDALKSRPIRGDARQGVTIFSAEGGTTEARCAAPGTTTETATEQRPRSDYVSWDSSPDGGTLSPVLQVMRQVCWAVSSLQLLTKQCRKSWEVASIDWGPKTSNRKVLDPLLRIGDANSNAS
jgi:hypothetical protein